MNTTIRGSSYPADPIAFSGTPVAGPIKTAIPVLVHARAEPLNTSNRLLGGLCGFGFGHLVQQDTAARKSTWSLTSNW